MSGDRIRIFVSVAGGLLWVSAVLADTPRELAQRGNEHYEAGRYAEALNHYEQAEEQAGGSVAALLHDRAAAHFKLGQFAAARELWSRAQDLKDVAFEARTHFNLGNCDYAEALASLQQQPDPQEVLDLLSDASEQYRTALRLDPTLTDARANLELTQLLRRQIEQQMQPQPQQQQGEGGEEQEGEREQQQEQSQQEQESENGEQEESSQNTPQTQPSEQDSQEQQQPDEQREGQEQPPEQAPPQDEGQEQEPEQTEQPSATPETMPAESQPAEQQPGEEEPNPTEMTRAQAERLLQMVRDAEQARREMLARQRKAQQKEVDRDW